MTEQRQETVRVGFLLLPQFAMLTLFCAIEPLRVANRFGGDLYSWHFFSVDGEPVAASNGIPVVVEGDLSAISNLSMLIVNASFEPEAVLNKKLVNRLRQLDDQGTWLGAMDTGVYALAYAGLLQDHQITLHWESLPAFQERFPKIRTSTKLYEFDGVRFSCSGGTAAIDMMLHIISQQHGQRLCDQVCEQVMHNRLRGRQDHQRLDTGLRLNIQHPALIQLVELMEKNLEEPLKPQELARLAGIPLRQMERLFSRHFNLSPSLFYLQLRLERARQLLKQTKMPVVEVAVACGFSSPEYFSRRYRIFFGTSPREDRKLDDELHQMAPESTQQRQGLGCSVVPLMPSKSKPV